MGITDTVLPVLGFGLLAVVVLKPDLINDIIGSDVIPDIFDKDKDDKDDDLDSTEDDGLTPNQRADTTLPNTLKAVNYYAGKIAGMVTVMANTNIYSATQIKQYILDRHIAEVEHIAQLVEYKTTSIDFTNIVALREIAKLALDISKELRIEYKVNDALALEVIANVGRGYSFIPPSDQNALILGNVSKYLLERFNNSPVVVNPPAEDKTKPKKDDDDDDHDDDDDDDDDDDSDKAFRRSYNTKKVTGSASNIRFPRVYYTRSRSRRNR